MEDVAKLSRELLVRSSRMALMSRIARRAANLVKE